MKIYLIRHAKADHLTENWSRGRISWDSFIEKMKTWNSVPLTDTGIAEAQTLKGSISFDFQCVYCSPLPRASQTANIINTNGAEIVILDDLKEIITDPPAWLSGCKFTILLWIYICIICGFFNGDIFREMRRAKEITSFLLTQNKDIVVVSHSMRIRSLVLYARLTSGIKVIKSDYHTCGMSIISS